jgi:hypothetical protein
MKRMNVTVDIHYVSNDNKVMQRGRFQLKGRKAEVTANEFWKMIKAEHPFNCEIEMVKVDGEDVTEKVKALQFKN